MATGGDTFPIWDRRNVDQQELVDNTPCKRLLEKAGVMLRRNLCTEDVLPHLLQLDVLDRVDVEHITHNAPRPVIVDRLVSFILTCEMWKLHGLLRACALTGQTHLIQEVGLDPAEYMSSGEEEAKLLPSSTEQCCQTKTTRQQERRSSTRRSRHQEAMPAQLLKAIVHHCRSCKRCLMRRNLYDLGDKDAIKIVDTTKCYIRIDPLREGEGGKLMEIMEKDILLALPGEEHPHVIRLEGQPGVGKTALTHHIVYDWSVEFLRREGEAIPIEVGGDFPTMIVHIAARDISTTVPEAIMENLRCATEDKRLLYDHTIKGNGTTVIIEGIDEIRRDKVLANVQDYIRERQMSRDGPQVLLTARTDLSQINIKDIDRFVTVKGFTVPQGFSYIRAYLRDQQELCQKVVDYAQAHQERLFGILTNPLRLHIFCALVSEGELELDTSDNLSILKLFTLLEKCILKREQKEVTESDMHNFYRMCLFGLLNGLREFTRALLDRFNIPEACHVFFTKKDVTDIFDKQATFSFPHESIYEHFAGRCMDTLPFERKKAVLLAVCSNQSFRNLQKVLFEVILQQEQHQQELLLLMIRAIFIFEYQPTGSVESWKPNEGGFRKVKRLLLWQPQFDKLTILKSKIQSVESVADTLLEHHQPTKLKNTSKVCSMIEKAFHGTFLQDMKWYMGLSNGVFGHISQCLQYCDPHLRINLSRETTERLLPCNYRDKKGLHMVHTVGLSRWAEVLQESQYSWLSVRAWCPGDVQEVLYKVRRSGYTTPHTVLGVDLTPYQDTWGQADTTAFCTQVWDELYQELTQWGQGFTECGLILTPSTPLQGLLQSEAGHLLHHVYHGTIAIEQLQQVLTAAHLPYTQRGVRGYCTLYHTTIVIPAGGDQAALSRMKDDMLSKGRPRLVEPKFVTETGEDYKWE